MRANVDVRVLDTNILSFFLKEPRDSRAALYAARVAGQPVIISFMTLAELRRWPLEHGWGQRRRQWLDRYLAQYSIHHADERLCDLWAEIMAEARRHGRPMPVADAWIAATALAHDAALVTHNPADFRHVTGLHLITEAPS